MKCISQRGSKGYFSYFINFLDMNIHERFRTVAVTGCHMIGVYWLIDWWIDEEKTEDSPIQPCCCCSPRLTGSKGCWVRPWCPWVTGTSLIPPTSRTQLPVGRADGCSYTGSFQLDLHPDRFTRASWWPLRTACKSCCSSDRLVNEWGWKLRCRTLHL